MPILKFAHIQNATGVRRATTVEQVGVEESDSCLAIGAIVVGCGQVAGVDVGVHPVGVIIYVAHMPATVSRPVGHPYVDSIKVENVFIITEILRVGHPIDIGDMPIQIFVDISRIIPIGVPLLGLAVGESLEFVKMSIGLVVCCTFANV